MYKEINFGKSVALSKYQYNFGFEPIEPIEPMEPLNEQLESISPTGQPESSLHKSRKSNSAFIYPGIPGA